MRGLGSELGVEAMALYRHFANKDELLEAMVDLLIGEITIPPAGGPWRSAIRAQAFSARTILGGRRWAQRLLATRAVLGPGTLRHIEGVTRALRDAGFSHALAHHTMHVLGARIYGFTQEVFDDALTPEAVQRFVGLIRAGDYPAMQGAAPHVPHDADKEFVFALDLLLEAEGLDEATAAEPGRTSAWSALEHRDFRLFWIGLVVSNIGTWMQQFGLGWLVVQLAIKDGVPQLAPFYLGLVGLSRALPGLAFGLFGGVVADRADRRRLLLVTQSSAAVFAGILAYLAISNQINIVEIVLISALNSIIFSFDAPTRQAMVPRLVSGTRLMSAIGLNSAAFNWATLVGPLIGGVSTRSP